MAGVYIKGMKMPKNCRECPCLSDEYDYCQVLGVEWIKLNNFPPDDCPLVEVTDHGDLIDRDELMKKHSSWIYEGDEVCESIKSAPVVIPAERSEEQAHWIAPQLDDGTSGQYYYRCSKCEFEIDSEDFEVLARKGADNYCPNCGTKMEDEDE